MMQLKIVTLTRFEISFYGDIGTEVEDTGVRFAGRHSQGDHIAGTCLDGQ